MELSRERLLLFAGAGLLGGIAGWAVADPLAGVGDVYQRALVIGGAVGIFVGIFLGTIEGLSAGHKNQTQQGVLLGGGAGLIGGGLGLLMGELAFGALGGMGGRMLGWSIFGIAVGLGVGWVGHSFARLRNGGIGGLLGGAIGGGVYQIVTSIFPQTTGRGIALALLGAMIGLGIAVGLGVGWVGHSFARLRNGGIGGLLGGAIGGGVYQIVTSIFPQTTGRGIALALLGAMIGLGIGLVGEILKRGWLMVVRSQSRNAREGKEYPLIKPKTRIGRAEESDIGLFGDQAVANFHAVIERQKQKYLLARGEGALRVNQQPVTQPVQLKNGDRVEVGGTLFLFRERTGA